MIYLYAYWSIGALLAWDAYRRHWCAPRKPDCEIIPFPKKFKRRD